MRSALDGSGPYSRGCCAGEAAAYLLLGLFGGGGGSLLGEERAGSLVDRDWGRDD
ncbi:MAG TPA: hypothetical protein VF756_20575 [Thermoanaerobaculia bacterium]